MDLRQFSNECVEAFDKVRGEFTPPLRSIVKVANKYKLEVKINGKAPSEIKGINTLVEDGFFDDITVATPLGTVRFDWTDEGVMTAKRTKSTNKSTVTKSNKEEE